MQTKPEFLSRMDANLKEMSAKIGKLRARYKDSKPDERSVLENDIEGLQQKYGEAVKTIEELKGTGDHEWEDFRKRSEELVRDLQETLNHALANS